MLSVKNILSIIILSAMSTLPSVLADQDWPENPVKMIVGYGAGGTTDSVTRSLANILEKDLGGSFNVENKPGGGSSVAAALVAAARPNGYTFMTLPSGAAVNSPHMQSLPYNTLEDFTFVAQFAQWGLGLVASADAPYDDVEALITYAKENPGTISYGLSGAGTPQHLAMEQLGTLADVEWTGLPFNSGAEAVTAVIGGHIQLMAGTPEWIGQVRSGELKLLAILTDTRMDEFPDVQTLIETGYQINTPSVATLVGPKGIPPEIVGKMEAAVQRATETDEFSQTMKNLGMQVRFRNSVEAKNDITESYERQGEIINAAGLAK